MTQEIAISTAWVERPQAAPYNHRVTFELPPDTRMQLKAEAHRRGLGPLARDLGFTAEITARLIAGLPVQRGTLALARERLAQRAQQAAPPSAALSDFRDSQNKSPWRLPQRQGLTDQHRP